MMLSYLTSYLGSSMMKIISQKFLLGIINYRGYEIAFGGKVEWNFGNDCARNVIIVRVSNSSSSHSDNCKKYFFVC